MRLQKIQIARDRIDGVDLHAAGDPPQYGRAFVMREVVPRLIANKNKGLLQGPFIFAAFRLDRDHRAARRVLLVLLCSPGFLFRRQRHPLLVADIFHQLFRHRFDRQNPIHHARLDCRPWHGIVFRFRRILRDCQAALRFNVFHSDDAVAIAARESD